MKVCGAVAGLVLGLALALPAHAQPESGSVEVLLFVEPSGAAKAIYLSDENGDEISADVTGEQMALQFTPGSGEDMPTQLTIQWDEDNSTTIPAFVFSPYAGTQIQLRIHRYDFTLADTARAEKLCFHTRPADARAAFRSLFGCQEWVHLLEANGDGLTKAVLRGLNGWFQGAYFLFTRVTPIRGLGLSPWGMQEDLVRRLRDVLAEVDAGRLREGDVRPLRVPDIRQALDELDRWELKLYGAIPRLVAEERWAEAARLNERVLLAYKRLAGEDGTGAIDGVSREGLESNAELIEVGLGR
jgi:hypothetical protein